MTDIKITAYSNKGIDLFYVSGVKGSWEQTLINTHGGVRSSKGSLKFTYDPANTLTGMGINFEYKDRRNEGSSSGAPANTQQTQAAQTPVRSGANQQSLEEKVWKYNGVLFVKTLKLKNNEQLKLAFKQKFDAIWHGDKEYWKIENANLEVVEVEQFLGIANSQAQPTQQNYPASQASGTFPISQGDAIKFQAMLNHVINGGTVSVS